MQVFYISSVRAFFCEHFHSPQSYVLVSRILPIDPVIMSRY